MVSLARAVQRYHSAIATATAVIVVFLHVLTCVQVWHAPGVVYCSGAPPNLSRLAGGDDGSGDGSGSDALSSAFGGGGGGGAATEAVWCPEVSAEGSRASFVVVGIGLGLGSFFAVVILVAPGAWMFFPQRNKVLASFALFLVAASALQMFFSRPHVLVIPLDAVVGYRLGISAHNATAARVVFEASLESSAPGLDDVFAAATGEREGESLAVFAYLIEDGDGSGKTSAPHALHPRAVALNRRAIDKARLTAASASVSGNGTYYTGGSEALAVGLPADGSNDIMFVVSRVVGGGGSSEAHEAAAVAMVANPMVAVDGGHLVDVRAFWQCRWGSSAADDGTDGASLVPPCTPLASST